jgi:transposase-like protein
MEPEKCPYCGAEEVDREGTFYDEQEKREIAKFRCNICNFEFDEDLEW